jgi:hypothetical protein
MDKTITTVLLIAISTILVLMLFNIAYPAIIRGGDAIAGMADNASERMRTRIDIVHMSAELDETGWWHDTNGNGRFDVFSWIKNTGDVRLIALDRIDVFFGPEGAFTRIPNQSEANGSLPSWSWRVTNDTEWVPTGTLEIAISHQIPLSTGHYFMKVILPNGISSEYFLGI